MAPFSFRPGRVGPWRSTSHRSVDHAGCAISSTLGKEVDASIDSPWVVNLDQRARTHNENHGPTHLTPGVRWTSLSRPHGGTAGGNLPNSPRQSLGARSRPAG